MQKTEKPGRRKKESENMIEKPSRMFISWKAVVPALAALGVGGYFLRGRQPKQPKTGMQIKQ